MILSDVSVKRPVFATVLSLMMVAFGVMSFSQLPLREYPDTSPPVVSISTSYPGASAEIIETQVTEPIEDQINGIDGNSLNRAEYKYKIEYNGDPSDPLDFHPFYYNIRKDQRELLAKRLEIYGVNGSPNC